MREFIVGRARQVSEDVKELSEILTKTVFVPELKARTKSDVLAELADSLVSSGAVGAGDRDVVLKALSDRESKMSTGMQYGVAIPHAKCDVVDRLVTIVAISHEGVDFDSLDGEATTIFVGTLSHSSDTSSHIKFLAEISRFLSSRKVRERLLAASTPSEMVKAVCGDDSAE